MVSTVESIVAFKAFRQAVEWSVGVQMMWEQAAGLFQARRIGVVAHDRVDVEFLGRYLKVVAAGAGDNHAVPSVAVVLRDRPAQIRITAGDHNLHRQDLLVSAGPPPPWLRSA